MSRTKNSILRDREYLKKSELKLLLKSAYLFGHKCNRERNELIIRLSLNHGLRSSELLSLTPSDIDFNNNRIKIIRAKSGVIQYQKLNTRSLLLLSKRCRTLSDNKYIFTTRTGKQLTNVELNRTLQILAKNIGLKIHIHHHMLRHSCGYLMINSKTENNTEPVTLPDIATHLGHTSCSSVMIYAELREERKVEINNLTNNFFR